MSVTARRVQIKLEVVKEIKCEDLKEKQTKARRRFRRIVKEVIQNLYWLTQEWNEYEGDDVKMRVVKAKRSKNKGKESLTISDKAIFMKRADDRTDEEIVHSQRLIDNLNCFKRFPHQVKKKLASRTYFQYVGPGRVVVREKQLPMAMYFVLSGEVVVTKLVYDEVFKEMVPVTLNYVREGGIFGEVSLLHGIPRSSTVTTTTHCEFLLLYTDDFVDLLYKTVLKEWMTAENAMSQFSYFKDFEPIDLRNCCIESKIVTFEPEDIIFGDGLGMNNHVYFLLDGRVQMIETLYVEVDEIHIGGRQHKRYALYEPKLKLSSESSLIYDRSSVQHVKACGNKWSSEVEIEDADVPSIELFYGVPESTLYVARHSLCSESTKSEPLPKNVRVYHMEVCQMLALSTFGIGENMMDRRIVAVTKVRCMILSRLTLDKISPTIWRRVQHYLQKKIPTKKQLFEVFVKQQRWAESKQEYIERITSRINRENATSIHDVPFSIRMEEIPDICYN